MTKRASALALAALAVTVFATSASAASTLSLQSAEQVAHRLALKEIRGRHIIAFHVTKPQRRSSREIDFAYDDRSRSNVYCTARMVTRLTDPARGTISGRIVTPTCRPIPTTALAVEAVTARALRAVKARRHAVNGTLARLRRSFAACATLRVPRGDRARVRLVVGAVALEALARPVDAEVVAFVRSLAAIQSSDPKLIAAQAAWIDYVAALRVLPRVPNPCAGLKRWARAGYRSSAAPVDLVILKRLNARTVADSSAIARTARVLAADGVLPQDVVAFTPAGLLLQLSVKPLISGIA